MLRSRVRRSFTVEVKSKNRQSLSWPDNPAPAPSPVNWAALDPAPGTPSPFETAWPDEVVVAKAPPVAVEKPRRILQSLIAAEPEPELPEPVVEREPRLPRVRRVKPSLTRGDVASTEAVRSDGVWSFADIADASAEPAVAAAPIQARTEVTSAVVAPIRAPHRPRTAEPALAPGERWKRRLPRALR